MDESPRAVGPEASQLIQAILKPIITTVTRASLGVTADGIRLSHQTQLEVAALDHPAGAHALRASDTLAPDLILDLLANPPGILPARGPSPQVQLLYDTQDPMTTPSTSTELRGALTMSAFWRIDGRRLVPMSRLDIITASKGSLEHEFPRLTHVDAWDVEGY